MGHIEASGPGRKPRAADQHGTLDTAFLASAGRYEFTLVPNAEGGYHVRVPGFPTIFTGGMTPAEAATNAVEAIALALEWYAQTGKEPPTPSAVAEAA